MYKHPFGLQFILWPNQFLNMIEWDTVSIKMFSEIQCFSQIHCILPLGTVIHQILNFFLIFSRDIRKIYKIQSSEEKSSRFKSTQEFLRKILEKKCPIQFCLEITLAGQFSCEMNISFLDTDCIWNNFR